MRQAYALGLMFHRLAVHYRVFELLDNRLVDGVALPSR